jgi:hypothetical protein
MELMHVQVSAAQNLSSLPGTTPITASLSLGAGTFTINSELQAYIDITSWPAGSSLTIAGGGIDETLVACSGSNQMLGSPLHINAGPGVNITLANMTLSHCNTTDGALRIIADATFFGGVNPSSNTNNSTSGSNSSANSSTTPGSTVAAAVLAASVPPVSISLQGLRLSNNSGAAYGSALQIDVAGAPGFITIQDSQIEGNCGAYLSVGRLSACFCNTEY